MIFIRFINNACPDGIKVYVGQTIDEGFSIVHDDTLETFSPEKPSSLMQPVVVTGKILFDLPYIFRDAGPFPPQSGNLTFFNLTFGHVFVVKIEPPADLGIRAVIVRMHSDEKMEVIAHQAETKHLREIDLTQPLDGIE